MQIVPEYWQPLPDLNVLRETYCSQGTCDRAVGFLESHNPEVVWELRLEERPRGHLAAGPGEPLPPLVLPDPTKACERRPDFVAEMGSARNVFMDGEVFPEAVRRIYRVCHIED
jgi:hypothetical protein